MQLKVQACNRNGDHQFPGLWDGRRTVKVTASPKTQNGNIIIQP